MNGGQMYDPVKRFMDLILATVLFVLTSPLQVAIAMFIKARLGSPVIFRQRRPGLNGEIFELTKFRTMREPRPGEGPEADGERLEAWGHLLRSLSLDELPTLWNVMKGDMSLVGPRPLLVSYLDRYTPEQARRHEVRPGITGLAQVSGRNALTWEEKFRLDVTYVERRSLFLDVSILARTVTSVIRRSGIAQEGTATMTEFKGSTNA